MIHSRAAVPVRAITKVAEAARPQLFAAAEEAHSTSICCTMFEIQCKGLKPLKEQLQRRQ